LVVVLLEVVAYTDEGRFVAVSVDIDITSSAVVAGGYNNVAEGGSVGIEPTSSDIVSVTELAVEQQE